MSEIKTKISTYNDVVDLFGEEKAADMLSEALDWSTIDPKNDKKNIMERKALLLDPYMTYENEDYCKHIVAGFLGDRDLDWASGYIDEEKIKNGQVMPADLKSALSMALDNELSTSWAYLDALSSQCAEIFNKFAGYIESAGLARGVLVPGEYELDHDALNADVSERFNIQYGFQCDQMIDAMQFDMTLILTEKVAMDDYSGPETKEGLRGMYHSPQDVSAFSDPFCGSVSVTSTRDEKQEPAKSGLEAKRDACALSAAHLDSPNTEIPNGKNMERE